jgi:hypothetical protein
MLQVHAFDDELRAACARVALLLIGVQPHALHDGRVVQGNRHA